jgi:hypothetical protein
LTARIMQTGEGWLPRQARTSYSMYHRGEGAASTRPWQTGKPCALAKTP